MKRIKIQDTDKLTFLIEALVAIVAILCFIAIQDTKKKIYNNEVAKLNDRILFLEDSIVELNNTLDMAMFEQPDFMYKSPKDGLMEALIYYGIEHPEIVYAQAILETGHFRSELCLYGNNLFGLYDSKNKHYHYFDHWAQSVEGYKNWVQNKLKPGEDYYEFLDRIGYAEAPEYTTKVKYLVEHNDKR